MRKSDSRLVRRSSMYRPHMDTLEDRWQPGTLLSTSAMFALPVSEIMADSIPANVPVRSIHRVVAQSGASKEASTATATPYLETGVSKVTHTSALGVRPIDQERDDPFTRPGLRDPGRSLHELGILPGSSIKFKDLFETFGNDPPTEVLQNVNILPNGAMIVNNADLPLIQVSAEISPGITATGTVIWLSNLRGTYSETTGKMTGKARFQLHVTSNAPGFNNNNCKVPPIGVNMATDKPGGAAFSNGEGIILDNTFIVNAIPDSACGEFIFVDYSDEVNNFLNLPSTNSGDNILTLKLRMTPSLPPP